MAHFAELDEDNKVINVLVFDNNQISANGGEYTSASEQWIIDSGTPFTTAANSISGKPGVKWKQTSFNTIEGTHYYYNENNERIASPDQTKAKRFRFAGKGQIYDETRDAFVVAKEFDSWTWNETNLNYDPPVARPNVEVIQVNGEDVSLVFEWHEPKVTWKGYSVEDNVTKYWNPNTNSWEDDYGS